ncbi:unnamed protein product [Tilletia controversa]|nr:hypothetical protein CF335_g8221 [Tilletia laevis]CAD6935004.1 unnamed protein product [Tilletia controversa]
MMKRSGWHLGCCGCSSSSSSRAEARIGRTLSGQSRISAQSTGTTIQQPVHTGVTAATTEAIVSSPPTSARPLPSIIYREEEVLLSLQLLAYVSKYPHVRELFHSAEVVDGRMPDWYSIVASAAMASANGVHAHSSSSSSSFDSSKWFEEDEDKATATAKLLKLYASRTESCSPSATEHKTVFSIAERFTLKTSSSRSAIIKDSRLSTEVQNWAGVIMRDACRKDESRGGVMYMCTCALPPQSPQQSYAVSGNGNVGRDTEPVE